MVLGDTGIPPLLLLLNCVARGFFLRFISNLVWYNTIPAFALRAFWSWPLKNVERKRHNRNA